MKLADVSISRPVFATMMIVGVIVFGIVLYSRLSIDLFPEVEFPFVSITVVYPGADPETMESQVADPIEEVVNSLSGIRDLRSTSVESVTQVLIEFELEVDPDVAVQDVRDRLATVESELPNDIETPLVQKFDFGAAPIMQLAVSGSEDVVALTNYVEDTLKPALERVRGVGQVEVVGGREREMHVWLDPQAMRSYGLTIQDISQALGAQNFELPGGRLDMGSRELVVRTNAEATSAAELADMSLTRVGGTSIRLRDVARVEDGFEEARSAAYVDGRPALAVVLRKQSDANTVSVADAINALLPELRSQAPEGTAIDVLVDNSVFIRGSIEAVQFDLALGALLAVVVIFLFLRDFRATIISALALPTSVIGAFGFVRAMGFTLNIMTTLALSLSIGILIDDAIVVIENIARRRSKLGEKPMEAARRGTAEIGLAVLATTLSIVAVFVPVAFMEGMIGQFFFEFGLTVAFAVMLSLFVSFTLTPMLSSRFLKAHSGRPRGLSGLVEWLLERVEGGYRRTIGWALRHRFLTMLGAVGALVGTFALTPMLGFEFMPTEDRGQFSVRLELPTGTSLSETDARARAIAAEIHEVPGVTSTFATIGGGAQELVNTATVIVTLVPREQRAFHQVAAMQHVRDVLADERGLNVAVEEVDTMSSGMRQAAVQLDLRGNDLEGLAAAANRIAGRMRAAGGFVDVDTTFRPGKPQLDVDLDRNRADDFGIAAAQLAMTVRGLIAGQVASQFQGATERYDIRVQLPDVLRSSPDALESAQLRRPNGALVDLSDVATISHSTGPSQIDRQHRQRVVSVLANLGQGMPLGTALQEVESFATEEAGPGLNFSFGGQSQMLEESMQSVLLALFIAIACIYMILAAQFESFIHPLTIMTSLPFSLIGALGALMLVGMNMGIFAMIGFIMLMGLVTKNAILLVDFANQRKAAGVPLYEALIDAGATRLRPILMTTGAMIFGMLPVAIGHGEGGELRAPMGVTVIGGLITSTLLTLVVVPVIYTFMEAMARGSRRLFGWLMPKVEDVEAEAELEPQGGE